MLYDTKAILQGGFCIVTYLPEPGMTATKKQQPVPVAAFPIYTKYKLQFLDHDSSSTATTVTDTGYTDLRIILCQYIDQSNHYTGTGRT